MPRGDRPAVVTGDGELVTVVEALCGGARQLAWFGRALGVARSWSAGLRGAPAGGIARPALPSVCLSRG
jgi:hypothetical protein